MQSLLFILGQAPHGSINAQEGLDALLMGSAFAQCTVLILGDGILQLRSGQAPGKLPARDFSRTFGALADYGVTEIYCDEADLARYNLAADDLVITLKPVGSERIRQILSSHNTTLSF